MITCVPIRPFSNTFDLSGPGVASRVRIRPMSEQGYLTVGSDRFDVVKHGPTSGFWTVERDGVVAATAQKPTSIRRKFEVRSESALYDLKAESPLTRRFALLHEGRLVASVRPRNPLTRKSTIEVDQDPGDLTLAFAFWLCLISWRRAQG